MIKKVQLFFPPNVHFFLAVFLIGLSFRINQSSVLGVVFLLGVMSLKRISNQTSNDWAAKSLLLCIITGITFLFPISNTLRYFFGILIVVIVHLVSKNWKLNSENLGGFNLFILVIQTLYLIVQSFPERFLQFLLYGYDNAFHFSLFRIYMSSQQYLTSTSDTKLTDFSLFRAYPGGYYAISSFLSSIFTGYTEDPKKLLSAYFLILMFCCFGIFWMSYVLVSIKKVNRRQLNPVLLVTLPFVSSVCILLTNGYPPYLYSLLILQLLVVKLRHERNSDNYIVWISIGAHILLISQPLVAMNLLLAFFFLAVYFLAKILHRKLTRRDVWNFLCGLSLGALTLFMVTDTSENFGVSTLRVVGGVQSLSVNFWVIQAVLLLFTLYVSIREKCVKKFSFLLLSSTLPFIFLISLTLFDSGMIGYYAIKQGYIWSFSVNLAAVYLFVRSVGTLRMQPEKKNLYGIVLIYLVILGFAIGTIGPKNFGGPFMGNLKNVVQASLGSKENWVLMGLDAQQVLKAAAIAESSKDECFLLKNGEVFSDLGSRWLNGLSKNKVTNSCFAVYWNSDSIPVAEMDKRILNSKVKVRIVSTTDS